MPINVMLVDDSTIIRGLISRALTSLDEVRVIATAGNGTSAIQSAKAYQPDVIILDIEMPEMDGITALPKILEVAPDTKIIMASTLTQSNASISMKALELGAVDYLPKPSSTGDKSALDIFYNDLRSKVLALGEQKQALNASKVLAHAGLGDMAAKLAPPQAGLDTRPMPSDFKAIAIASSTGGPQALQTIFDQLEGKLSHVPIFITQHMPETFTKLLAENISKRIKRPCTEGVDGQPVMPAEIYIAPGNYHMLAKQHGDIVCLDVNQDEPENFCRPAVDPMLRSLSAIYKDKLLVLVLTGMGQDGLLGAQDVVKAGGFVIAQDQASSVVYGMPRAVAEQGLCSKILPLDEIASYLVETVVS